MENQNETYYYVRFHDGSYKVFYDLKEYQDFCDKIDMKKVDYVVVNERKRI